MLNFLFWIVFGPVLVIFVCLLWLALLATLVKAMCGVTG